MLESSPDLERRAVPGRSHFARITCMHSKLANQSKQALLAASKRLTPEQRLESYVVHCRLVMDLYAAGQQARAARTPPRS